MPSDRERLLADGFLRIPSVIPLDLVERLRAASDAQLERQAEATQGTRAQGSLLTTQGDPVYAELIAHPALLGAIRSLGWPNPTFTDGYVISKPPGGPRLFWHYDWFAWTDPSGAAPEPAQLFAMVYLDRTARENGCLRVIPGTHVRHNPLHDLLPEPHSPELSRADDLTVPAFSDRPDEVDVPVQKGDLLLGDARLLHAAHGNGSDRRRTLITLWYQPDPAALSPGVRAQVRAKVHPAPEDWPETARASYEALLPPEEPAEPYPRELYVRGSRPA